MRRKSGETFSLGRATPGRKQKMYVGITLTSTGRSLLTISEMPISYPGGLIGSIILKGTKPASGTSGTNYKPDIKRIANARTLCPSLDQRSTTLGACGAHSLSCTS